MAATPPPPTPAAGQTHLLELRPRATMLNAALGKRWTPSPRGHGAHITGLAEPIDGSEAHSHAMQRSCGASPNMHVTKPYPIQFGAKTGSPWSQRHGTFRGEMSFPTAP